MTDPAFLPRFLKEIDNHVMEVVWDDGVNRHIRFRRPGTMCLHFDLITWPGYLCYTGDMGTYVFRRLLDMFQFFRCDLTDKPYRIDLRYWAEKVEAQDKGDGISAFSIDAFKAAVKDYFEQATSDEYDWPAKKKAELWTEIENDVLDVDDEHSAWENLRCFEHKGFEFDDWENQCKEYSHRFLWCCHALEWAITTYDKSKEPIVASGN